MDAAQLASLDNLDSELRFILEDKGLSPELIAKVADAHVTKVSIFANIESQEEKLESGSGKTSASSRVARGASRRRSSSTRGKRQDAAVARRRTQTQKPERKTAPKSYCTGSNWNCVTPSRNKWAKKCSTNTTPHMR